MKNTFSLCFLTFICFLVLGYSTSTFLFFNSNNDADISVSEAADKSIASVQSMENGQRNILLIRVDSVDNENPTLQGIWLLTYLPTESNLYFFPVFPSGRMSVSTTENKLYQSFNIVREDGQVLLSQTFTDELRRENYWWSGYLVFDQKIQEKMLGFFAGTYPNKGGQYESKATQISQDTLNNASGMFANQLSTIKTACQYLASSQNTDWDKFIFLMSNQFYSDLGVQQLISDWNSSVASKGNTNCQFPTLLRQAGTNYSVLLTSVMK